MPFEYYNIEDDIAAKLTTDFAASSLQVDVVTLPEDEDDVVKAIAKPRVTVAFVATTAGKPQSTNEHSYHEDITVVLNVQWKALRGSNGCHTLASLIKKFLIGYQPSHCGRMYFKNYQGSNPVRNPDDKLWYWDLEFGVKKVSVQVHDDNPDPDGPPFTSFTGSEQIGCTS